MADEFFGLSRADVEKLRHWISVMETDAGQSPNKSRRPLPPSSKIIIGVLTSPVVGTSALIPTAATVGTLNVYRATSTGFVDTGFDETVYSLAIQDATTDRVTICERDATTGKHFITTQFCS